MLQEIEEQPLVLETILVKSKEDIYEKIVNMVTKNDIRRIILTGCGDSYCAALTNAYAFTQSGFDTHSVFPMEYSRYLYKYPQYGDDHTLLIPISVSGRTPRVIETVHAARSRGCHVLSITNNPDSPVAELSDEFVYAKSSNIEDLQTSSYKGEISKKYVGYEHDVPQTKSYTAVQMTLQIIAESLKNDPDFAELKSIPDSVREAIHNPLIKELGEKHSSSLNHIYCASGPNYGNALFGEFKMYEFSLPGNSKEIEEYCHTSYFITEEGSSVMFLAPKGESLQRVSEIVPVLKNTIKADPIVLSNKEPDFDCENWIEIPFGGSEEFSIIPYGVVAPIFAYWIAKGKGMNVNTFRGGVEQERYVEGSYYTIRKSKLKDDY